MKEIKLTQGKVALVDDEDFERLNKFEWHANWDGRNWYITTSVWVNNNLKTILMNREILNAPKHMWIDYKNGNGLDNRKENLRIYTDKQKRWTMGRVKAKLCFLAITSGIAALYFFCMYSIRKINILETTAWAIIASLLILWLYCMTFGMPFRKRKTILRIVIILALVVAFFMMSMSG